MPTTLIVWRTQFELQQMRDYLDVLGTALQDYEARLENKYSPADLEREDDEFAAQYERYLDLFSSLLGDFPYRLYTGFVLTWYAFVEDALSQLCRELNLEVTINFSDSTGLGAGILRARNFLEKGAGIDVQNDLWRELDLIRKIRNQIVHQAGKFEMFGDKEGLKGSLVAYPVADQLWYIGVDSNLFRYLQEHEIGAYYGTYFIRPNADYCRHLVILGEQFFARIFQELYLD